MALSDLDSTGPPPRWLVLTIGAPPRGEEMLLVDALKRLGARLVDHKGSRLVAYFQAPSEPSDFLAQARSVIGASLSPPAPAISWELQTGEGWRKVWERDVAPRRVSERFLIVPSPPHPGSLGASEVLGPRGGEASVEENPSIIRLLPSLAFGTAEHPTTRACLQLLEEVIEANDSVVDVGAGSGILSIAAALLGAGKVLALEMDPHGAESARQNVRINNVACQVEVNQVEVRPDTLPPLGPFGGALANLEPDTLLRLVPGIVAAVAPGGWVVFSGAPGDERRAVRSAALREGLRSTGERTVDGWWTESFRKRPSSGP